MRLLRIDRAVLVVLVVLTAVTLVLSSPASALRPARMRVDLAWADTIYLTERNTFRGWIGSSMALCLSGRSAQLMKVANGPDRIVGTGISNRFGMVDFPRFPRPVGRYYVEFSPVFRYDAVGVLVHCDATRSPELYPVWSL